MFGLILLFAFVIMPIVEIAVILQVGGIVGVFWTVLLLVLDSLIGAWLVRREGSGVMRRIRDSLGHGTVPSNELVDGLLILVAGALMLTPGFVTDGIGLIFLIPPTRAVVRNLLVRRYRRRVDVFMAGGPNPGAGGPVGFGATFGGPFGPGRAGPGGFGRGGDYIDVTDLTRNPDSDSDPDDDAGRSLEP